jgi:hypothetical protein
LVWNFVLVSMSFTLAWKAYAQDPASPQRLPPATGSGSWRQALPVRWVRAKPPRSVLAIEAHSSYRLTCSFTASDDPGTPGQNCSAGTETYFNVSQQAAFVLGQRFVNKQAPLRSGQENSAALCGSRGPYQQERGRFVRVRYDTA